MLIWSVPLQWWGGVFYLLHKVFCSRYERQKRVDPQAAQNWRTYSWLVYMAGLPAVVLMLLIKEDWIFAALEASALPVMMLGLALAWQEKTKKEIDDQLGRLDPLVYILIGGGLGYSFRHFGGFVTANQWLEIVSSGGFLAGTYLQAKDDERQYIAYAIMNTSTAILFWRQDYSLFAAQQVVSFLFIADAWLVRRKSSNIAPASA